MEFILSIMFIGYLFFIMFFRIYKQWKIDLAEINRRKDKKRKGTRTTGKKP